MKVLVAGSTGTIGVPLDRALMSDALLAAVDGLTADAVIHELTALKRPPVRHGDMAQTNALRTRGTAHLLVAARTLGAHRFVTQSMVFGCGYGDWATSRAPRRRDHDTGARSLTWSL